MSTLKGQKGLSLVEVTIMLLVLMLLTGVLAPSIFDFVQDAKRVKVKEDCEAIGLSIMRLARDVNPCLMKTAANGCAKNNRIDLLYSDGLAPSSGPALPIPEAQSANVAWDSVAGSTFAANNLDTFESQLVTNGPSYNTPVQNVWGNQYYPLPAFATGWRGAYVAPPIGPDPWGRQYQVSSIFLSVAHLDAGTGGGEGSQNGGWAKDTICVSAGENGKIDTPFYPSTGFGTTRQKDDFVYVIAGGTR